MQKKFKRRRQIPPLYKGSFHCHDIMKLSKKLLMAALAGAIIVGGGVNTYAAEKPADNVQVDEKSEEQIPDVITKVEIREIEAPIKYQASDKLKLGEIGKKPLKKPVNGKVKVTITTKIIDGKEVKEEKEEVLVKEQAGIFEVGNKEVKEEITKFKTIEKKDDTLAKGVRKVKVKGKDGKVINTVTYDVDPVTGKLNNIKTNVEVKDKVVDEVILVGTNEKLAKQQDKKDKKDTKTPKKKAKVTLPKAGSEAEIITLSVAAVSTAAGAYVSIKKRK